MSRLPELLLTDRLLLRLPVSADVAALNEAIRQSHAELKPWMDWAAEPQTLEETRNFCEESARSWKADSGLNFLIVEADGGEIIGSCGYPRLNWTVPKFEIGYWCRTDRVGRGYISEASYALAEFAFEDLAAVRVELRMDDRNQRSWRVAEGLGFRHEATLKSDVRAPDGSLRDSRIYAATSLSELRQRTDA